MGKKYAYTGFVGITMTTKFTSSTTASSKSVATTMDASLSGSFEGGSASVSTKMSQSNDASLKTATSSSSTETVRFITGVDWDQSCLDKVNAGPCETMINSKVSAIAADVSKQPLIPTKHTADVTIDDIVQGYFNDTKGLGSLFFEAVEDYYSYRVCDKPGCPSSKFSIVRASGSKQKAIVFDPEAFCGDKLLGGALGSLGNQVFCDDTCPNIRTDSRCLEGILASCPIQQRCPSVVVKTFLNPEYITDHPGLVEVPQCLAMFVTWAPFQFPAPLFPIDTYATYNEIYIKSY